MRNIRIALLGATLAVTPLALALVTTAGPAMADKGGQPNLGNACDRASATALNNPHSALGKGCFKDIIVDTDGFATPGPGSGTIARGTALTSFVGAVFTGSGLDMFDQDHSGTWTPGDALHSEGSACSTAIRDGVYEAGADCVILDTAGTLTNGEQVSCDIEVGVNFAGLVACPPTGFSFVDLNANGGYDVGEPIVIDTNGNGIFD